MQKIHAPKSLWPSQHFVSGNFRQRNRREISSDEDMKILRRFYDSS